MSKPRSHRSSLSPGAQIGGCRIQRQLGAGGMGEVYLAEHLALCKQVAVKVLPPDTLGRRRVARFLKEARSCSRIDHPNVVTIHDVGEQDNIYYIIMQYVHGKNLRQLIQDQGGPLPWRAACHLIRLTAKGLHAVHGRGLVHRDVKPDNIMLSQEGRLLLMDFGLVRDENDPLNTQTGTIVGTPGFMSPEQCLGTTPDPRSDVFSLGSTYYYLLTATPPYRGSMREVIAQISSGRKPRPVAEVNPRIPAPIAELVERAMAPEPAHRFSDARSMARAIRRVLHSVPENASLGTDDDSWRVSKHVETIPELIPLEAASSNASSETWSSRRAWGVGTACFSALLLIGIAINLVVPSPENDLAARSKKGMVFIETGNVQLGNDPSQVTKYLKQMLEQLTTTTVQNELTDATQQLQSQVLKAQVSQLLEPLSRQRVQGFWIDRYEVTNAQYARFVKAENWEPPDGWSGTSPPVGKKDHPVENVRFRDAEAYASWAGKKLPTSKQWTRAYRGDSNAFYPWGNQFNSTTAANVAENTSGATTPITATPEDISPFGVSNMVGNVSEYVRDAIEIAGTRAVGVKGASYVLPGFSHGIGGIRQPVLRGAAQPGLGFRCVIEEP